MVVADAVCIASSGISPMENSTIQYFICMILKS